MNRWGFTLSKVVMVMVCSGVLWSSPVLAQKQDEPTEQRLGETEERPTAAPRRATVEEIVEALKKRARAIVEARKPRLWRLQGSMGHTFGYENNVNLDTARQGDWFNLTDTTLNLTLYHWRPLEAILGYAMSAYLYWEYRDNSYISNTPSVKLRYRPWDPIRLEGSFEWEDLTYFDNTRSSLDNFRYNANLRHTISETAYHQFGFQYFFRPYETREARGGFSQKTFTEREDDRHTATYEVGTVFGKGGFVRIKNEWYKHSSNDAFQDYYDYQVYKMRASVFGPISEQWSLNGSISYEGKHYKDRNVPNSNVAERDDTYTWTVGTTYQMTRSQSLAYTWTYKELLSNDPRQEYVNTIHQLAYTYSF